VYAVDVAGRKRYERSVRAQGDGRGTAVYHKIPATIKLEPEIEEAGKASRSRRYSCINMTLYELGAIAGELVTLYSLRQFLYVRGTCFVPIVSFLRPSCLCGKLGASSLSIKHHVQLQNTTTPTSSQPQRPLASQSSPTRTSEISRQHF
jgi:hypothetical protein